MPGAGFSPTVRQLIRAAADPPDAELLRRFVADRDEESFATLVRRHGPMVLDVCRCVLGNTADADDAFQAVFLVLARKAGEIRSGSVAGWLYGVADRTAHKARARAVRRREQEAKVPPREPAGPDDLTWAEVRRVVHEELAALPDRYRLPLVLCYLQGQTQDDAAGSLGLSHAAVKKRLERGREKLRAALTRRGLGPTAVLAVLAAPAAVAGVPPDLAAATTRLAAHPAGTVPPDILVLAEAGVTPMILSKLHAALSVVAVAGLGAVLLAAGGQPGAAPGAVAAVTADDKNKKERPADREMKWLAGEWKVKHAEAAGKPLLDADQLKTARVVFEGGKGRMKGLDEALLPEFSFKVDPTKAPKEIDVTFLAGPRKGDTVEGIYLTRTDEVRICLRLTHPEFGRPKGYATAGGTSGIVLILEPVAPKDPPPFPAPPRSPPAKQPAPAPADDKKEPPAEREMKWLAGEWRLKHVETNGEGLLDSDGLKDARVVFKGNKAELKGFRVVFVRDFSFKLDPTKNPKEIDVTFLDGEMKGQTFEGIYVTHRAEVRICLRLTNPELGRPKGYYTISGTTLYTFILEPVEKKDPPPFPPKPLPPPAAPKDPAPKAGVPGKAPTGVAGRLVVRGPEPVQRVRVYHLFVEFERPGAPATNVLLDPADVALELTDKRGRPVAESPLPRKELPSYPIRGLIPVGGYTGLPLNWPAGVTLPPDGALVVAGRHAWTPPPGEYTIKGSGVFTFPDTLMGEERQIPLRAKVDLKPATFVVPE